MGEFVFSTFTSYDIAHVQMEHTPWTDLAIIIEHMLQMIEWNTNDS